ncbi:MAG: cupredoxin domain-containing protein [Dehalococcoidia bacterium]|nr:cupredoxin domain-containing protein [Dehalococcoidia bacterium]
MATSPTTIHPLTVAAAPGQPRGAWTTVLTSALIAVAVLFVGMMLVDGEFIPPLAVFGVVFAGLAAGVTMIARRWMSAVAGVASLAILALHAIFGLEDFAHPETFFSFVPTLAVVTGTALAVVSAAAVTFRLPTRAAYPAGGAAVALVAAAIAVSGIATAGLESDARATSDVSVVARDVEFPDSIAVNAGEVSFFVQNKDRFRHTFVIEGQDVKTELPGSTARRVTATLAPGTYTFKCDVPGHESMKGTIIAR